MKYLSLDKNISLLGWMNVQAERRKINFSRVLQNALAKTLSSPPKSAKKGKSKTA